MIREHRLPGTLAACRCGKQPKHLEILRGPSPSKHRMECPPCMLRTAECPTLQEAVEAWEAQSTERFDIRRAG